MRAQKGGNTEKEKNTLKTTQKTVICFLYVFHMFGKELEEVEMDLILV